MSPALDSAVAALGRRLLPVSWRAKLSGATTGQYNPPDDTTSRP